MPKDKDKEIKSIKIDYVDLYILSFVRVDCEEFENYFEDIKRIELNKEKCNEFIMLIKNLEPIDSSFSGSIDTRAKVELNTNKGSKQICLGLNSLVIDTSYFQTTDSLKKFISDLNDNTDKK